MKLKQYKLKRDLPTFKAGEIFHLSGMGNLIHESDGVVAYSWSTIGKFPNILTDWFEEVKEPLIKDEKIRKAVRAWAEALKENTIRFDGFSQGFSFGDGNEYSVINFDGYVFDLEEGKKYTIAELCGEEEE